MTVSSSLTTIVDFEITPTYIVTGYGGGAGAGDNTDVFIEGIQSGSRRVDNAVDKGFGLTIASLDLSAAGTHIKFWLWVTQWAQVTQVQMRLQDSSANEDDHELPVAEYPVPLGGFIPVWVDVSRTPETDGSADITDITEIGCLLDIGNVGGNADNFILDEWMHGTNGLLWTGLGGDFQDFRDYEDTNAEGNLVNLNGVDFVYSRLDIGSTAATTFIDSGFTLVFPDQSLVADDFMGITVDLSNATSAVTLANATIQSANPAGATKRPDFVASGISGVLAVDALSIVGMRRIEFTSKTTVTGGILDTIDLTQNTADITEALIRTRSASGIACLTDPTFAASTEINNVEFVEGADGHALQITTAGEYTLTNVLFTDYGLTGNGNAAVYVTPSSGIVTLNIAGGDSPTYRTNGATVVLVVNPVTTTITVKDINTGDNIENARVLLYVADGTNFPHEAVVSIVSGGGTATVTHSNHGLSSGDKIFIQGVAEWEYNGVKTISVTGVSTYTYSISGAPASPATGSPTATMVIIDELTTGAGVADDTRSYPTDDQLFTGRVRYGASPFYKTAPLTGTIDRDAGYSVIVQLIPDA